MELRAGDAVWGGWTIDEALPPRGGLLRWRVRRADEVGELVLAGPSARLRDVGGDRARAAVDLPGHPAVLPASGGVVKGVSARISAPTTPWPPGARVEPDQAAALLAWLAPGVLAAAEALGGELDSQDLVVDADGMVRIAPSGAARERSLARLPRHQAPEWQEGSGTPATALYGLGVLLYEAVTGAHPIPATSLGDLEAARRRPVPARQARPDLPASLADALDALVSPDPARRLAVASAQAQGAPVILPVDASPAASGAPSPALAPAPAPAAPPRSAARDIPMGEWVVLFDPERATATARRRLAALLDVPEEALQADHPLVVAGADTQAQAEQRADTLSRAADGLQVQRAPIGRAGPFALLGLAGLFAVSAVAFPGLWTLVALVMAAGSLLLAKGLQGRMAPPGVSPGQLARRWSQLHAATGAHPATTPVDQAHNRLRATRRQLLEAPMSDAMRTDLLDSLDDLSEQLVDLPPSASAEAVGPVLRAAEAVQAALAARGAEALSEDAASAVEAKARAAAAALKGLAR